jgi:hypothetical protein
VVVSGQLHSSGSIPPRKFPPLTYWEGSRVGPRFCADIFAKRKSFAITGSRTAVFQPIGTHCSLSYLDWLIWNGIIKITQPERRSNSCLTNSGTVYQTARLQTQEVVILTRHDSHNRLMEGDMKTWTGSHPSLSIWSNSRILKLYFTE